MNSQRFAVKHIAKSLQAITKPKLVKELACPTAPQEIKSRGKPKEAQLLTKAIRNLGNALILKFIALNKISSKLKINRLKISNYA